MELETFQPHGADPVNVAATESNDHTRSREHLASSPAVPPADTGKQAWLFLAACVAVEVLVWGQYSNKATPGWIALRLASIHTRVQC